MILVERIRSKKGDIAKFDLQVSETSELPAINNVLDGFADLKVGAGSIAQVIQTGAWYTLDENGTWYDSDGQEANATNNTSSLASPAVIDKGALLGQGKSILTADETEQIEPEIDEPEQNEPDELDTESEVTEDER